MESRNEWHRPARPDRKPPVSKSSPRMMNLMFDPRVVRGPTLVHKPVDTAPRNSALKKLTKPKIKYPTSQRSSVDEAANGRKHMNVQTDSYLEELPENISEYDIETQTDPFLDRPPSPLFIPQKSGPDVGTQIEEGDLFNFDEEVEPMLEVLVGRTLEQAVMEVMEEKQLSNLRAHQENFEKIRAAELVATQRMEAAERRIVEEKKARVEQEKLRVEKERILREKIEAEDYARKYLKNITDSIFDALTMGGYFYDPVEREVETIFLPTLESGLLNELKRMECARFTLNCLIEDALISKEKRACEASNRLSNDVLSKVEY